MIYSQKKKVSADLCGPDAKLSVVGALCLVENSLTELTGELHIDGVTAINKYGAVIIYCRNHIRIFDSPCWNDNIVVESFVSSKSKIRFYIDTCIKMPDGEVVAYSRTELCSIDLNTKRLRKTETTGIDDEIEEEEPLYDISLNKKENENLSFVEDVKVRSSNIDYAHHTNNIEYIKFLLNTFSVSELEKRPVKDLEINYSSQSFENDILGIYALKNEDGAFFEIKKEEETVLTCEMKY